MVKVVHEKIGIVRGSITTVHNVTNTQTIVDAPNTKKDDLRRARSGMTNLAPTTTGSATAIALIFPELKGKLNGHAIRVPLLNSSITDCVFEVKRSTTTEELNQLFKEASETYLKVWRAGRGPAPGPPPRALCIARGPGCDRGGVRRPRLPASRRTRCPRRCLVSGSQRHRLLPAGHPWL